jgi:hypothetical protein
MTTKQNSSIIKYEKHYINNTPNSPQYRQLFYIRKKISQKWKNTVKF